MGLLAPKLSLPRGGASVSLGPAFPRQAPEMVEEMVRVAHFDVNRVKELANAHPALAKAAVDWGFGDWEDALGAASHTGRYDIAQFLLSRGARPTIFSAAMMGEVDAVRAFVAAAPGIQTVLGPHSLTLMWHAKAGGERARATLDYLRDLRDADNSPPTTPLEVAVRDACLGVYVFGDGVDEHLVVEVDKTGDLTINRPGLLFARNLRYVGANEFFPIGAEQVRIRFAVNGDRATSVAVLDPQLVMTATRQA
jgi:hypothetical protein